MSPKIKSNLPTWAFFLIVVGVIAVMIALAPKPKPVNDVNVIEVNDVNF